MASNHFTLRALLGRAYSASGGDVAFTPDGATLLSPVGNRILSMDLKKHSTVALDCETRSDVKRLVVSPDGRMLLAVDIDGYALVINLTRGVVIARHNFKGPVTTAAFNQDGSRIAIAVGRAVQIWRTPSVLHTFSPFSLLRSFTLHADTVTCLSWSPNSKYLVTGSADLTARVVAMDQTIVANGYIPVTLAGHREPLVGAFFADDDAIYTISSDCAVFVWVWEQTGTKQVVLGGGNKKNSSKGNSNSTQNSGGGGGGGAGGGGNGKRPRDDDKNNNKNNNKNNKDDNKKNNQHQQEELDQDDEAARAFSGTSASSLAVKSRHSVPAPYASTSTTLLLEAGGGGSRNNDDDDETEKDATSSSSSSSMSQTQPTVYDIAIGEWKLGRKHYLRQQHQETTGTATNTASITPSRTVTCATLHVKRGLLVVGLSDGLFGIHSMPTGETVHTLSISRHPISSVAINAGGDWLAFGSSPLSQLLVWEWTSETYVIKQQGHGSGGVSCTAFSPNGQLIATGGEDGRVKVWSASSGFAFVTFTAHTGPVTGVTFAGGRKGHGLIVLSSSLDGTVRAYDLVRYRNFRTMAPPEGMPRVQFSCVAADEAGEVVTAGGMDPFHVFAWSLQTGKVLDVLPGHEGPISSLSYNATAGLLASASWDKTVRIWDMFRAGGTTHETFLHGTDVTAVAFRPDGEQLIAATLDGNINVWDVKRGVQVSSLDVRRDLAGGRKADDVKAVAANLASNHATSLAYTADGSGILVGGNSRFVCLYALPSKVLVRRFPLTHNRSIDGILTKLRSNNNVRDESLALGVGLLKAANIVATANRSNANNAGAGGGSGFAGGGDEDDDDDYARKLNGLDMSLPGVTRGDSASKRNTRRTAWSRSVHFSPSGDAFSAVTPDGVTLYTSNEGAVFDPLDLGEDITADAVEDALAQGAYARALLLSLHLNEPRLLAICVDQTPAYAIPIVVSNAIPRVFLPRFLHFLATTLSPSSIPTTSPAGRGGGGVNCSSSGGSNATSIVTKFSSSSIVTLAVHVEFGLMWCLSVLKEHADVLRGKGGGAAHTSITSDDAALMAPALAALQQSLLGHREALIKLVEKNAYALEFLTCGGFGEEEDDEEDDEEEAEGLVKG